MLKTNEYRINVEIVYITECEFVIRVYYNKDGSKQFTRYQVPTSNLTINYMGWIGNKFETIEELHSYDGSIKFIDHIYYAEAIIRKSEEGIYERLQKAFEHLATFCPKKKETF